MKFSRFGCILAACALSLAAQTPPAATPATPAAQAKPATPALPPDKAVITVGDQTLTVADFDAIVESVPEQYRDQVRGAQKAAFADSIVKMLALAQEARRRKLDQTPSFQTLVRYQSDNILAGLVYNDLAKAAAPKEADLRKYYDDHKAEYEEVQARHILIRFAGSPVPVKTGEKDLTDAEALAKVQALRKRIAAGEDFAKLAEAESDDTGSGAKGGDLGAFTKGQMVPEFDTAAFALEPGTLSQPVKTQFGYHLIKVESRKAKTFEEVRPELEQDMGPAAVQKAVDDLVGKVKATLDPDFFPKSN